MRGAGGAIVSKTNKFMASHGNFFNLALGYIISFARSLHADSAAAERRRNMLYYMLVNVMTVVKFHGESGKIQ